MNGSEDVAAERHFTPPKIGKDGIVEWEIDMAQTELCRLVAQAQQKITCAATLREMGKWLDDNAYDHICVHTCGVKLPMLRPEVYEAFYEALMRGERPGELGPKEGGMRCEF